MWVGLPATSFVMEAGSCGTVEYWAKSVIASPTIIFLSLGPATPALETTA